MPEAIQGLSLGLGLDTTGIEKGMKQLRPKLSAMNSELKASMSAYDRGEKSVDKYQTQIGGLTKKLGLQKQAVNAARTEYDRMVATHGEGSRQAERASTVYNNQVASFNNLERHVEGLSDELRQFEEQQRIAASGWTRMSESMEATGGKLTKIGDGMKSLGAGMTKSITAPLVGIGLAGVASANTLDEAYKTIRTGTGATGEALEDLKGSFKNVFENVPESADEVSTALADLNTRTGLSGPPLEALTEQFLALGRVSGEEVPDLISKGTRAFGDWGIAVDDQAETMDYFWKVSQTTGIGVSDLMNKMVQFGAPLRQMGFDFETSAALLGKFEKEGVNAELVMGSMRQALGKMAKEGIDAETGLEKTMEAIEGAGSASEANAAAIELFGARAGPDMAAAIREGRFEIDDLIETMAASEETIAKAGEETVTFGEKMAVMKNKVTTALEPIGDVLLDIADNWIPKLETGITKLTGWFEGLGEEGQESAVKFGMIAAAAGPVLVVLGGIATAAGGLVTALAPVAAAVAGAGGISASFGIAGAAITTFATGPIGIGIAAITGLTIAGGAFVKHMSEDAIPEVDRFGEHVSDSTKEALGGFFELSDGASESLMDMRINGLEVTELMADELLTKYEDMNAQILESMRTRYAEENEQMKTFFADSATLSEQEEAKIMMTKQQQQEKELGAQQLHEDQIQLIVETAATEKRELTEGELAKIDKLHQEMNESAVVYLSENEMEQKIIMERMASTADELSAQQAAAVTKNSADARDKVIEDAEQKYNDTVAMAIRERDETGTLTEEQAQKIIDEATRTKDESVKKAEEMHSDVVSEAKLQAGEHVDEVDWQTGEILSKWDIYKAGVVKRFKETNEDSIADFKAFGIKFDEEWTNFNDKAKSKVDDWKAGVKKRFKETNEESLADFKRWGTNFDEGWTNFNDKAKAKVDDYKAGVKKRFKETNEESLGDFKRWGTNFDEGWTNFNDKAKSKVDDYKAGVKRRFKETNEESLADFKRWGGNLKDWAGDAKKDIMKTFDNLVEGAKNLPGRIGGGISSMASKVTDGVKKVSNKLASGLGDGVNGVIKGVNWVLKRVGSGSWIDEWDVPEYAHGTKGHPGGLAIVGDGIGSNAGSELIQTPNGKISLSPPKDTVVDLPKGSQVLSAKKTKELLGGLPKYANGIGDMFGGLWQGTKNLGKKAVNAAFDIWDYVKSPNKLLNVALGALGISSPKGGSFVGNMAKGGFTKAKDAAIEYVKGKLSDFEESNAGSGQGFSSPFRLTSKRGWRIHPITGRRTFHQGDDWGAPQGTRIPSQSMGTVVFSGYQPSRGNTIRIRSGAYEHLYQHNSRNSVGVGQVVRRGQTVGLVGSTGDSTGPHLHHELKKNGMNINPQGFADGGLIKKAQLAMVGEGDKEEVIIPVGDPTKRTNAMKLLALAAKKLGVDGGGSFASSQIPEQNSGGSDSQVVELLKQQIALLQALVSNPQLINVQVPLNSRAIADETYEIIEGKINVKKNINRRGRGG